MWDSTWNLFETYVLKNQFASGGIMTVIMGSIAVYCRALPGRFKNWFYRQFTVSCTIPSTTEQFYHIHTWLTTRRYIRRCRNLMVVQNIQHGDENEDDDPWAADKPKKGNANTYMVPDYGRHFFMFRRRPVIVSRFKDKDFQVWASTNPRDVTVKPEEYHITVFGRSRKHLEAIFKDAESMFQVKEDNRVKVYFKNYHGWTLGTKKLPRELNSVITKDNIGKHVCEYLNNFKASRKWYEKLGIPYHTGVLFYGPSGNGKTSQLLAIASECKMNLAMMNLSNISNSGLVMLLTQLPKNTILALEDIDCTPVTKKRETSDTGEDNLNANLGDILNVLDGLYTPDGLIVFMTTNHIDKLDTALIRPGRVDLRYYIGQPDGETAAHLFHRFFDNVTDAQVAQFASKADGNTNMASLQAHCLKHRYDLDKCLQEPVEAIIWNNVFLPGDDDD